MGSIAKQDNRSYPRKNISTWVNISTTNYDYFLCYMKNLSLGGIMVESKQLFEIGTELILHFKVYPINNPIEIKGQVVWNHSNKMDIKFKDLDVYTSDKLEAILSSNLSPYGICIGRN